jgi:apolipoprotein N-acyltransferase
MNWPQRLFRLPASGIAVAVAAGFLLQFAVSLEPIWWLAWLVPAPLLLLANSAGASSWRVLTLAAALIATSSNATYFLQVMPVPIVILVVAGQALIWMFVVSESRRALQRWHSAWAAFAYPVLWVAVDTLMAAILPDGNWGSLAYTQSDVPAIMQVASLFGVAGVLFPVALLPSAIATAILPGRSRKSAIAMLTVTVALVGAVILFGLARLEGSRQGGATNRLGLAAIDDAIGLEAKAPYVDAIRREYEQHIAALAADGARIVLLPEKIAVATESAAIGWQKQLAAQAKTHKVWLNAGMAVQTKAGIENEAWWFSPEGKFEARYRKHFMAPPERGYLPGREYMVQEIEGTRYGIAICKDMHFASLGRAYGERGVALMLVPAWDFGVDGWLGARMTAVRGIENGYMVVRAAREGRLTVADAYGRVLAEQKSAAMPGRRLRVDLAVPAPLATLYTQIGNSLGWACVAGAAWLGWRTRSAVRQGALLEAAG